MACDPPFECRGSGIERYGNARPRARSSSILTAAVRLVNDAVAPEAQLGGIVRKLARNPSDSFS
jgi:hypothetical protein